MSQALKFRTECLCCGSKDLAEIINLGLQPMADAFIPADHLDHVDEAYPLICDFCPKCQQVQLRTVTDPQVRYVTVDYSYTSSNSNFSRTHWTKYATAVSSQCHTPANSLVVEIGSNDGYLLEKFKELGFQTHGVDPSPVMAELAAARGIQTENDFFSLECSEKLLKKLPAKPTLIAANNVFNHANDPVDFARGVKNLLSPIGTFVFELPYWLCSIESGQFDQIYHEHVSYFTAKNTINLFKRVEMHVVRIEEVDYHGGSIRVFVKHQPDSKLDPSVNEFVERENKAGIFKVETYHKFMKMILTRRNKFLARLYELKASGNSIVCAGAAAKGNTFLNFYNLDSTVIDYVTDSSPNKIGKYTPKTRIPIQDDQVLAAYKNVYLIILSWNIAAVLKEKLALINPNIQLLNPYELLGDKTQ